MLLHVLSMFSCRCRVGFAGHLYFNIGSIMAYMCYASACKFHIGLLCVFVGILGFIGRPTTLLISQVDVFLYILQTSNALRPHSPNPLPGLRPKYHKLLFGRYRSYKELSSFRQMCCCRCWLLFVLVPLAVVWSPQGISEQSQTTHELL